MPSSMLDVFAAKGRQRLAAGASDAEAAFKVLMEAKEVRDIHASYSAIAKGVSVAGRPPLIADVVARLASKGLAHRSKQLIQALETASKRKSAPQCAGMSAVIIGAGPIG